MTGLCHYKSLARNEVSVYWCLRVSTAIKDMRSKRLSWEFRPFDSPQELSVHARISRQRLTFVRRGGPLRSATAELLRVQRHKVPDAHRRPAGHPLHAVRQPV